MLRLHQSIVAQQEGSERAEGPRRFERMRRMWRITADWSASGRVERPMGTSRSGSIESFLGTATACDWNCNSLCLELHSSWLNASRGLEREKRSGRLRQSRAAASRRRPDAFHTEPTAVPKKAAAHMPHRCGVAFPDNPIHPPHPYPAPVMPGMAQNYAPRTGGWGAQLS